MPVDMSAFSRPAVLGTYNRAKQYPDEPNSRSLCEQYLIYYWPQEQGWVISWEQRATLTDAQKRYHKNVLYFKSDNSIEYAAFESNTHVRMTQVSWSLTLKDMTGPSARQQ